MRCLQPVRSFVPVARAAVVVVILSACTAGASASPVAPSTPTAAPLVGGPLIAVNGIATAGPVCPVERPGDPGCDPRPVPRALLIVTGSSGEEVARVTTGPDGRFTLALPPGDYTLEAQPIAGLLGTARPVRFAVAITGRPTPAPIHIEYDTGIR